MKSTNESPTIGTVLLSEEAIRNRVRELGRELTAEYEGKSPVLVSILKGAFIFLADLVRTLDMDCELDFMVVSSYEDRTDKGGLKPLPINDPHVELQYYDTHGMHDLYLITVNFSRGKPYPVIFRQQGLAMQQTGIVLQLWHARVFLEDRLQLG